MANPNTEAVPPAGKACTEISDEVKSILASFSGATAMPRGASDGALDGRADSGDKLLPTSGPPPDVRGSENWLVCMAGVEPQPVDWLWPGRFPLGKVSVLQGDPKLGKSFLTLDMAARVSTGRPWPDQPDVNRPPAGVLLLSAEDDPADTIRPRLDAAGADPGRINCLRQADFTLGLWGRLEQAIMETPGCRLVVIDPVSAYLGKTDAHRNEQVRGLLAPIADVASRCDVAVVLVTHLNKGDGFRAIYGATGSIAFVGAARAIWGVVKDPDDGNARLFLPVGANLTKDAVGLRYRISGGPPRVVWSQEPVTISIEEAMGAERREPEGRAERAEAGDWLQAQLANGPKAANELFAVARGVGISKTTLKRAKAELAVISLPMGFQGEWMWELLGPKKPPVCAEGVSPQGVARSGDSGRVCDPEPPQSACEDKA